MDNILIENLIELSSWRIASTLVKRHPTSITAFIAHPGGGQSDVLWLIDRQHQDSDHGDIMLNRSGTIHVEKRFDRKEKMGDSQFSWGHYLSDDHKSFVRRLEDSAGLPNIKRSPTTSNRVLVYQLFVHLLRQGFTKTFDFGNHEITYTIKNGYFDSSGQSGSKRNIDLDNFKFGEELLRPREHDLYGNPFYRFWVIYRKEHKKCTHIPLLGFEESSATMVILESEEVINLMSLYNDNARNIARFFKSVNQLVYGVF